MDGNSIEFEIEHNARGMQTGLRYFLLRVPAVQSSTVRPLNRAKSFTLAVTKIRS